MVQLSLPEKYKPIETIRSAHNRYKLKDLVISVLNLIKKYEVFEPSIKTKKLINQFFNYLTSSCENSSLIDKRSNWLVTYAGVIEHYLISDQNYRLIIDNQHLIPTDFDLTIRLSAVVESLSQYRSIARDVIHSDEMVVAFIDDLVMTSSSIIPNSSDTDYIAIIEQVEAIKSLANDLVRRAMVVDKDQHRQVILMLYELKHSMYRYAMSCSVKLQIK